jgi:hypothetical protein
MEYLDREQQLALPPKVRLDMDGAPTLNGVPPSDDPRVYGMTDDEAREWNYKKKMGLVGKPTKEDIEAQRRLAYASISDPLFFGWQRGENTEQDWLNSIQSIKDQYPYPSS